MESPIDLTFPKKSDEGTKGKKTKKESSRNKNQLEDAEQEKKEIEEKQCGICLDRIKIQGTLNSCAHPFCMICIKEWSKTSNTCPFCKARFTQLTEMDVSTILFQQ
jgi:PHD and RING finger domain-containing protein 1